MLITIPLHDISCEHKFYKSNTLKHIPFLYLVSRKLHPKARKLFLKPTILNTTDKLTKHEQPFILKKDLKTEKLT